jgi:hypothetical protein
MRFLVVYFRNICDLSFLLLNDFAVNLLYTVPVELYVTPCSRLFHKRKKFNVSYSATFIVKKRVKQSRYTPWRRLGGEEV